MERLRLIVLSAGKITFAKNFYQMHQVHDWIYSNFSRPRLLRADPFEEVYSCGDTPINVIIAPIPYN